MIDKDASLADLEGSLLWDWIHEVILIKWWFSMRAHYFEDPVDEKGNVKNTITSKVQYKDIQATKRHRKYYERL